MYQQAWAQGPDADTDADIQTDTDKRDTETLG